MKHITQFFIITLFFLFTCNTEAQVIVNKSYADASINKVFVYNIAGNITVKGVDSDEIKLHAELITGNQTKELFLEVDLRDGMLFVYMKGPCSDIENKRFDPEFPHKIVNNNGNCNYNHGPNFTFPVIEINIEVPREMESYFCTINEGFVKVDNVVGKLWVSNVNGSISLNEVDELTNATTVNGDIDVSFIKYPKLASCFKTINGDITIKSSEDINNEVKFKSFSGDLYANSDEVSVRSSTTKSESGKGTLKIENFELITLGNGGPLLSIETFNGNAYIQKIK